MEIEETTVFSALAKTFEFVYMYHMSGRKLATAFGFFVALAIVLSPALARASELVMFERTSCIWCQRWDRDIGAIYDKTQESKLLPLRRVNLDRRETGNIQLAGPVLFTPTFVVVDNGREIGRITGYMSEDSFWGLLGTYADKLRIPRDANRI